MYTLMTPALENSFNVLKAKFTKESTEVGIDHPILQKNEADRARIQAIAAALGFNLSEVGAVFRVVNKGGKFNVYPTLNCLKGKDGKPALQFGKVTKALSELPKIKDEEGAAMAMPTSIYGHPTLKRSFLAVQYGYGDGEDVLIPMQLKTTLDAQGKKVYPKLEELTAAHNRRKLGDLLTERQGFTSLGNAMAEGVLEPGIYTVIGYEPTPFTDFKGNKATVIDIQGHGKFKGNTTINAKLADQPEVSEEKPAELSLIEFKPAPSNGYMAVCEFFTAEDRAYAQGFDEFEEW